MKKLSKITESIWSDIQDRSSGETVRKEDDLEIKDIDSLVEYLNTLYDADIKHMKDERGHDFIVVTILRTKKINGISGWPMGVLLQDYYGKKTVMMSNSLFPIMCSRLYNKLRHLFTLKTDGQGYTVIQPDEGKVTNRFFIDVLDTIIDNIDSSESDSQISRKTKPVKESIWSDIQDRSSGEVRRKEDGVKVHTCIDVDIYLKNASDSYYDELIKEIIDYNDSYVDYRVAILNIRDKAYSTEEMKNIRAFEAPYAYLIYDGGHGTDLIAEFWTYDEMKDFDLDDFEDRVIEDDYISICKGIATKLKEVGRDIEYLPRNKSGLIKSTYQKHNRSDYEGDYVLQLISESDVYDWEIEYVDKYGEGSTSTCLEDFRESMIDTFPELDDVDFITWSYNNRACNIGIPITAMTVKNFKKYKEYTKNWFTVDEEAE